MIFLKKYFQYLILLAFCLVPIIWFLGKGNALITGLDTNFPLNPLIWFIRRLFVWNSTINAGSDFSSSTSGLFFHLVQVIPYLAGLPLKWVEAISLIFWFGAVVLSSYFMSRLLAPKIFLARIAFVAVYTFNVYLYNTWENIKVSNLALVVSLPLFLTILHLYLNKLISFRRFLFYTALSSVLASGTGINPAYFLTLLGGITLYFVVFLISTRKDLKKNFQAYLLALAVIFLVNIFWIAPLFNDLFFAHPVNSLVDLGFTNWIASLSENTSILNVIRLQGAWDWYAKNEFGLPLYIPYSLNYFRNPAFILFSFVIPALSLFAFIFRKKDFSLWYNVFAAFILVGIFLGVGVHEPTGQLYKILVQRIPFFSFFRSPWYIFTPYLTLSYAGLICLFYQNLAQKFGKSAILYASLGVFLLTHMIYSYPLITGRIFRPGRPDSFYIKFPDYIWSARDWLKGSNRVGQGRIITYPDDQLESFDWGYRGTETILELFSNREFITPSFNFTNRQLSLMLDRFYLDIKRGDYKSAFALLPFFGADTIFAKFDSSSLAGKIDLGSQEIVNNFKITTFGKWSFLESKEPRGEKIFSPQFAFINLTGDDTFPLLAKTLNPKTMVVAGDDSQIAKIKELQDKSSFLIKTTKKTSEKSSASKQEYEFSIPKKGNYSFYLELKGSTTSLDDFRETKIILDNSTEVALSGPNKYGFAKFGSFPLVAGNHKASINFPEPKNLINMADYIGFSETSSLRAEELPPDLKKTMVIYDEGAKNRPVVIPVSNFDPFVNYLLSFDYKYVYGNVPIIDIIQSAPTAPVKTQPEYIGSSFDWAKRTIFIDPVDVFSKIELFIKPGSNVNSRSKTFIENLKFERVYDNELFVKSEETKSLSTAEISFKEISPTEYIIDAKNAKDPYFIVFSENYSSSWQISSPDFETQPVHFNANGYGNAWYIQGKGDSQKIRLSYFPQNYFNLGMAVSLITISTLVFLGLKEKLKNEKTRD